MMILVIGGSGSGKSSYAEGLACTLAQTDSTAVYYLATMRILDGEGRQKVDRHRALRSGKGFLTIEQPVCIEKALSKMAEGERTVLLECVSNLAANEMFIQAKPRPKERVAENILRGVSHLQESTRHLIVVSNNVFEDGMIYDPSTMEYIDAMGMINGMLAARADQVVEVVAGIPVPVWSV